MNLKKLFRKYISQKNIISTPTEFGLCNIIDEQDLALNAAQMPESYHYVWKKPPQSCLCFMGFPQSLKGGGIKSIFLLMERMSAKWSLKNYICFYPICKNTPKNMEKQKLLVEKIKKDFPNLIFEILPYPDNFDDFPEVDIALCNLWVTAYPLLKFKKCRQKFYQIQDYESLFSVSGSVSAMIELTYKFGFIGITNSKALKEACQSYSNAPFYVYQAGVDKKLYHPLENKQFAKECYKIVFYGRPSNNRNAFETLVETFKIVKAELGSKVEIISVGENYDVKAYHLEGVVTNLGLFSEVDSLAKLYRESDIGVSFITTPTYSYQHLEFLASGLCLVTNSQKGIDNLVTDNQNAVVCPPLPKIIAARMIDLINNPDKMTAISQQGLKTVESLDWDKCFAGICDYIIGPKV